jgi:hypothetical protein
MDVHADKIQVAVYRDTEASPYEEYESQTDARSMGRLLKRLKALPGEAWCVYEAGPCGYELQRYLACNGIKCEITAPALKTKKVNLLTVCLVTYIRVGIRLWAVCFYCRQPY